MGICDSRGVCYDFAGPYFIGEGRLAFGKATRVLHLDPEMITADTGSETKEEFWDRCIAKGNACCEYPR